MKALALVALIVAAWLLLRPKGSQAATTTAGSKAPDVPDAPPASPAAQPISLTNNGLDNIAQAIFNKEGPGIRDTNMNPGNLRSASGQAGTNDGFAQFGDWGDGWDALSNLITSRASAHPNWDFYDFFTKYLGGDPDSNTPAPANQGNADDYADYVAGYAGFDPTQTVSSALWSS